MIVPQLPSHFGPRLLPSRHMVKDVQFRYPRSKKKRIRQKWAKNRANWRTVPRMEALQLPSGDFVMHPVLIAKIRELGRAPE